MHSFPAIVLQPGALISLVQVELFPSCSLSVSSTLARFYSPFDSNSLFSLLSLSHSTLTRSPLFIFWLSFSSMLLAHSLTSPTQSLFLSVSHALSLVITEESRRPDKSSVAMATAKWPDSFSTQTSGGRVAGKLRWSLAHLQTLLKASGCCNTGAHIQVCTQALCDTNHVSQGRVHIYILQINEGIRICQFMCGWQPRPIYLTADHTNHQHVSHLGNIDKLQLLLTAWT